MILRSLLFVGVFFSGAGCPHPMPPVEPPTPVYVDAGTDASPCNVPQTTEDKVVTRIVNACAGSGSIDAIVATYDVLTVRCVAADILLDVRGAPKGEACVGEWLRLHGGAP
jgi:hypothetical protein